MPDIFLHAPQDFRNLCAIARTLEVLGHREVYVFDRWQLIRERYGKSRSRQMRDVSAGAFQSIRWRRVDDPPAFLADYPGRSVAAVAEESASSLACFEFRSDDLLIFGGESQGLPAELVASADATLTISAKGSTQSLNLSVAVAVIVFEAGRQASARLASRSALEAGSEPAHGVPT
jgi:tRNA(Leu) C34 or U34 (ribose-2'-O)-methylase TrmL